MVLCHSMTAGGIVETLRDGGNTQTLTIVIELILNILHSEAVVGMLKYVAGTPYAC